MDYFAQKAGLESEAMRVARFFNEQYGALLDSADYPNAYIVYIAKGLIDGFIES